MWIYTRAGTKTLGFDGQDTVKKTLTLDQYSLVIFNIKTSDAGTYTCRAVNTAGVLLGTVTISSVGTTISDKTWYLKSTTSLATGYTVQALKSDGTIKTTPSVGDTVVLSCGGVCKPGGSWSNSISYEWRLEIDLNTILSTDREYSVTMSSTSSITYQCRITGSNCVGNKSTTKGVVELIPAESPTAVLTASPTTYRTGETATLTCTITGYPISSVQIALDGGSALTTTEVSSTVYTATISSFSFSEAGKYTCSVSIEWYKTDGGDLQTETKTSDLTLEYVQDAVTTLTSSPASPFKGDSVTIICEVVGYPEPSQPLLSKDGGSSIIFSEGCSGTNIKTCKHVTADAQYTDSGTYKCVGSNTVGGVNKTDTKTVDIKIYIDIIITSTHDAHQEPTEASKQPIRTRYLGHVTGYQPINDQYFLIRSVPDAHTDTPPSFSIYRSIEDAKREPHLLLATSPAISGEKVTYSNLSLTSPRIDILIPDSPPRFRIFRQHLKEIVEMPTSCLVLRMRSNSSGTRLCPRKECLDHPKTGFITTRDRPNQEILVPDWLITAREPTNQNSLFRSRDWLAANQRPVFLNSVLVTTVAAPTRTTDARSGLTGVNARIAGNTWERTARNLVTSVGAVIVSLTVHDGRMLVTVLNTSNVPTTTTILHGTCPGVAKWKIFSLPGWMPKASTRMPFCFAKRHSRVRIRKRHFGILTNWSRDWLTANQGPSFPISHLFKCLISVLVGPLPSIQYYNLPPLPSTSPP
eukprot:sb/3462376/